MASDEQGVTLATRDDGVAFLTLGSEDEKVVTLTGARMQSLRQAIEEVQKSKPKALVVSGPNASMFTAGADINAIKDITDVALAEKLAAEGQAVFQMIAELPMPTVAAISGPCVGGGCELVLACDYRIASDEGSTTIGLPETKLGIVPGFGGTQRLPRLVGLPKALDIILAGKTLRPSQALKSGLVDLVVGYKDLHETAVQIGLRKRKVSRKKIGFVDWLLTFTGFGRGIVKKNASQTLKRKTGGHYPAPPRALECCIYSLEHPIKKGLPFEAKALAETLVTPESKALVNLFFLTENAKAIGKAAKSDVKSTHGLVIGAGVMGAGIAGALANKKCQVILKDTSEEAIKKGLASVRKSLSYKKYLSEAERSFILNRIETTTSDTTNIGNCNFAIEAIVENLDIKKKVFADLASKLPDDAIIASNTSSLSVSKLAEAVSNPGRVVGMHFFNPVDRMPLVEIIRANQTDDKTIAIVAALSVLLGKFPIVVEDVPGFLVNRILAPYLSEAGHLLQEGFSIEVIDKAAKSFGMPMGPVRLLDEVGLDVAEHVSKIMVDGYGARMEGPSFAAKLAADKRLGKKSGRGFYVFEKGKKEVVDQGVYQTLGIEVDSAKSDMQHVQDRLVMRLLNEAIQCLDEGVAGEPGRDAANQIDLGTVMGTGFPPFRGGIVYYAEAVGAAKIYETLEALHKSHGDRYTPWTGIASRADKGGSFYSAAS